MDANVQKIVDAGFSEEQAENALKYTKNNVDRALKILQKRDNSENRSKEKPQKEPDQAKRKGRNKEPNDEDGIPVKPSGKVCLFDFLEDKLPNVPERDRNSRQFNSNTDDRSERNYGNREKNGAKNSRAQSSRFDSSNRHRSENRGHYSNDNNHHARDDRKYQSINEKPPRFQKKLEEKNKQHQHQQQQQQQQHQANINMTLQYNNAYQNPPPGHYSDRNMRAERHMLDNKMHQPQNYRNNTNMESLVEAAANLSIMSNQSRQVEEAQQARSYQEQGYQKQSYVNPNQNMQEIPPFRSGDMQKYQEQTYQRRQQPPNGYMESASQMYGGVNFLGGGVSAGGYAGRPYGYGARQEFGALRGGPFLPGSLLGFQNAAVNEQARAMLGVADISWKVGDRCLALYWEDNNVSHSIYIIFNL